MMGWNDYIENEGEGFVTLPEGDYDYTVTLFEKGEYPGSAKIEPCKKAILELTVVVPGVGKSVIKEQLLLSRKTEWKLCEFFRSIGQKQHGTGIQMDWSKVLGAKGCAHVIVNEWVGNDGEPRTNNRIGKYLDPETELGGAQEW